MEAAARILTWRALEVEYALLADPAENSFPVEKVVRLTKVVEGVVYPVAVLALGEDGFRANPTNRYLRIKYAAPREVLGAVAFNTPFALVAGEPSSFPEAGIESGVQEISPDALLSSFALDMGPYWLAFNPREYRMDKDYVPLMLETYECDRWVFAHMPEAVSMLMGARRERVLYVADGGPTTGKVAVVLGHEALVPEFEDRDDLKDLEKVAEMAGIRLPRVRTNQGWRVGLTGAHSLSLLLALPEIRPLGPRV